MATKKVRRTTKRAVARPSRAKVSGKAGKPARTRPRPQTPDPAPRHRLPRFVVGIGASAGGLQALTSFFENTPIDTGMAFVVVTHQQPNHKSMLPALLARSTRMPVEPARGGVRLEPNHVYVSVPGKNLAVLRNALHLTEPESRLAAHLPIDLFFRSLAKDLEDRAICIVLSGTGTDGTLGLRAVKATLGLAIIQDEESAQFPGMPHSASATLLADHVLSPDQIPAKLVEHASRTHVPSFSESLEETSFSDALSRLFVLLRRRVGHDFSGYKRNTIERRLARRMRIHQLTSAADYLRLVQVQPHELDLLFQELLITVTHFFRDPQSFEALADTLRQRIEGQQAQSPLRIWVPGCSTGEEAYSIAMLVTEIAERAGQRVQLQMFATDINPQVVEIARAGLYPIGIAADVGAERLERFFIAEGTNYRIAKRIRDCIVFATQDVVRDPPFTRLDLLSCRNLLIYLSPDLQQRLLPLFHYSLKAGGSLLLGSSETASAYFDLFAPRDRKSKLYERRKTPPGLPPTFDLRVDRKTGPDAPRKREAARVFKGLKSSMEGLLLDRFAPATIVFSDQGDVAYVHGRTGAYLENPTGDARHNVFALARDGLRTSLRAAVRAATATDGEVTQHGISTRNTGSDLVTLVVQRITEPESLRGLFRASFTSVPAPKRAKSRSNKRDPKLKFPPAASELALTRDSLDRTMDELQTSNDELKLSNEELQSTNEELQSTNEELETSKEELQSVNEELHTVNSELQMKNDELGQVNDDMQNLLNGTEIATLFLDRELRIKRFTDQARRVVRLIATDVGRPIGDLARQVTYDRLGEDAHEVLRTLQPHEAETQTLDGHWLLVRILPYRTAQDRIEGVVITFVDIDRVKRAELLAASREFAETIVQAVPAPLVVLDAELFVVSTNRAFSRLVGSELTAIRGHSLFDIGSGVFALPQLRALLMGVLTEGRIVDAFEFIHERERHTAQRMLLNARRLQPLGVTAAGHVLLALQVVGTD